MSQILCIEDVVVSEEVGGVEMRGMTVIPQSDPCQAAACDGTGHQTNTTWAPSAFSQKSIAVKLPVICGTRSSSERPNISIASWHE